MRTQQTTALRTVLAAAVPVGLVLSAAVVWQSTSAAFTATTDNPGNSWQSGTVVLTDSDRGSALFTTAGDSALVPGSTRFSCIQVDYTGNVDADIRLYVTTPTSGAATLDPYLEMTVEQGQNVGALGTVAADCTGFPASSPTVIYPKAADGGAPKTMQDLKTTKKDWTSGIPVGVPVGTPAKNSVSPNTPLTFRITYLLKEDNGAQGKKSTATFTWEAHIN